MKKQISIVSLIIAGIGVAAGAYLAAGSGNDTGHVIAQERARRQSDADDSAGDVKVEVVKPRKGGIERTTTQPVTVESFESARLFSKVSGYLKEQRVDIGDRVKRGDVLAEIEMPEMEKQVQRDEAAVEQAEAYIVQMEAHLESAKADYQAAEALIGERVADVEHATSTLSYKTKVFHRIQELVKQDAIQAQLADEKEEDFESAKAGLSSSRAALVSAKAVATASKAKIDQAQAELEKDRVFLNYTIVRSPYDGVITFRGYHRGDFINARDQGATIPVLTVDRTDKMRCVVQIPDLDVPFVNKGDEAVVEIDALPGRKLAGTVARVSNSEDQTTRTMRTEIDLMNDKNLLRDGMYGKVTVMLDKAPDGLTVPSSALVGESHGGKGTLYVIRGGKAHKLEVSIGADNGVETEIVSGLKGDDDVVVHTFKGSISNGVAVAIVNDR